MAFYANLGGDSGVESYQIQNNSISVTFSSGITYLYTYSVPGREHVENMKTLAKNGSGLNSYIKKYVRKSYARKY